MNTAFVIDGFNFYHSIKNLSRCLRWFNYTAYCHHFLRKQDIIHSLNYCTALAEWRPNSVARHKVFIEACKLYDINVIEGRFKNKTIVCENCGKTLLRHEEKESDVNMALTAYRLAAKMEQVILVSGDSDLVPAIRSIKSDFPNVRVGVVFPFNRLTRELKEAADFHHKTRRSILEQFILPQTIEKPDGSKIICPESWK